MMIMEYRPRVSNNTKDTKHEKCHYIFKITDHLIIDVRGLSRGVERRWAQRSLETDGRMPYGTLTCSNRTWPRNCRTRLTTAAARGLLLRLHLRGNQLRIRQRVSIFPQGTWCFVIFNFLFTSLSTILIDADKTL